jgi:hypothetical protein
LVLIATTPIQTNTHDLTRYKLDTLKTILADDVVTYDFIYFGVGEDLGKQGGRRSVNMSPSSLDVQNGLREPILLHTTGIQFFGFGVNVS